MDNRQQSNFRSCYWTCTNLFTQPNNLNDPNFTRWVYNLVTAKDNVQLLLPPTMKEIRKYIWSLSLESSVSPDESNDKFYQTHCPIIKEEMYKVIFSFSGALT